MATAPESAKLRGIALTVIERHGFNIASAPVQGMRDVIPASKDGINCLVRIQTRVFPKKPSDSAKQPESRQCGVPRKSIDALHNAKESNQAKNAYFALIARDKDANCDHFVVIDSDAIDDLVSNRLVSKSDDDATERKYHFHLRKFSAIADWVQQQGKFARHHQWNANEDIPLPANRDAAELSEAASKLFTLLVGLLVPPTEPQKYLSYQECVYALGLNAPGGNPDSVLSDNGMLELAQWLKDNHLPALTGLLVNQQTEMPGVGYFSMHDSMNEMVGSTGKRGRFVTEAGKRWWRDEITTAQAFDWSPYIGATPKQPQAPALDDRDIDSRPDRVETTTSKIIRDSQLAAKVKAANDSHCQLCGETIALPNGKKYAEAHHLQPLGAPHNGPDISRNMICVCPNCHARLDFGAIQLDKAKIATIKDHVIGDKYIQYHNKEIYQK